MGAVGSLLGFKIGMTFPIFHLVGKSFSCKYLVKTAARKRKFLLNEVEDAIISRSFHVLSSPHRDFAKRELVLL